MFDHLCDPGELMGQTMGAAPQAGDRLMSLNLEAVAWAWAQPIANNPGARIVLLCLAGMADDAWECAASQDEIAEAAMLPPRSVRRYLQQLEDDGHIRRSRRYDEDGHRLPDTCRLDPARSLPANLDGRQVGLVANLAGRALDLVANLDGRQVSPLANLAGRDDAYWPIWPVGNQDEPETPSSGPVARLAGRQDSLWPDWPVGEPEDSDIPSSEPVANLAGREIPNNRSSSPTENYEKENLSSSSGSKRGKAKPADDAPPRADVEQLCARLLHWVIDKDYRQRPESVPDAWRREARLLLDKDRVPFQEALEVLDWCQQDRFWRQNIHAMPKFRDKYGDLEMKSRGLRGGAQVHHLRPTGTDGRPTSGPRATGPISEEDIW